MRDVKCRCACRRVIHDCAFPDNIVAWTDNVSTWLSSHGSARDQRAEGRYISDGIRPNNTCIRFGRETSMRKSPQRASVDEA